LDDNLIEKPTPAIELNRRIHPMLNDVIMQCVEVNPEARPTDMSVISNKLNLIHGIIRAKSESGAPVEFGSE
ncbi:MAG: hypothetical protein KDA28_06035, partial [Phycisphaerales bacterium]|nr:hypothetical protein [Phycisphaerales bacterium]